MKIKLRGNQCAIYEVPGVKKNYFIMVNSRNEILMNMNFCTPMSYIGTSVEDVEGFYLNQFREDVVFISTFKPEEYQPVSSVIFVP